MFDPSDIPETNDDTELRTLRARMASALAWAHLMRYAYDALRSYGVDYQKLPAYHQTELLEQAGAMVEHRGQPMVLEYIRRLHNDIRAAIRRQSMRPKT